MPRPPSTSQANGTPDASRRRRDQWRALAWQWSGSSIESIRKCRRVPVSQMVGVDRSAHGAGYSGVHTCASVWSCPRCSAGIWARRAEDLDHAVREWDARGGTVAMVTLTMRHAREDRLTDLWDALSSAWAAATGNYRSARDAMERERVEGWARVVEATHGVNGWHLHVHALVFLRGDAHRLGDTMFDCWAQRLARTKTAALRTPDRDRGGLDVRVMDLRESAGEVARYVAKATFEATRAVASELAGQHTKAGRGNRTPWQVLADLAAADDPQDRAIWREWEQGSRGRRALTWKKGTRELLGLGADPEDDELADDLALTERVEVTAFYKDTWKEICKVPDLPSRILELVEQLDVVAARQAVHHLVQTAIAWEYVNSYGRTLQGAVSDAPVAVEHPARAGP